MYLCILAAAIITQQSDKENFKVVGPESTLVVQVQTIPSDLTHDDMKIVGDINDRLIKVESKLDQLIAKLNLTSESSSTVATNDVTQQTVSAPQVQYYSQSPTQYVYGAYASPYVTGQYYGGGYASPYVRGYASPCANGQCR